jgi:thymidylate kinase/thymidylate synthase ThyX
MNTGRGGAFVVVEGTDGSGKGTQFKLLADRLQRDGYDVETFDFPQYEKPSSYFVREYLNGKYGGIKDVGPYTASLFYALDRFEAANRLRQALDEGKVVLANRYVGSSMAHQGTKFEHAEERRGYFIWLDNLEFEMLRIPRPDFSFVLRVPAEVAQKLVDRKAERSYTKKKRDLHESDLNHLHKAAEVYDDMCQLFPKDFVRVDCTRGEELMDINTIHEILWQKLEPVLPPKRRKKKKNNQAASAVELPMIEERVEQVQHDTEGTQNQPDAIELPQPDVEKIEKALEQLNTPVLQAAKATLEELVTSMESDVFALTHGLSSTKAALVIAQLSQRSDDVRSTILAELHEAESVTVPGGATTAHLLANHLVVQGASLLLSKKIERGRLATYVERASRLIAYDKKDDKTGKYRYYTPPQLDDKLKEQYQAYMDQMFNLYAEMVNILTDSLKTANPAPGAVKPEEWEEALRQEAREALRSVLPVAATTDVAIYASGFALESIITGLVSDTLPEARQCGALLLTEARKNTPSLLENGQLSENTVYQANRHKQVTRLAHEYLPGNYATPSKAVQLTDVWPRNELDIVPDMLYEHANLPLAELRQEVGGWRYDRKLEVFEAYIGDRQNYLQRPGRALEKVHYSWDLVSDFDTFRDLQRHRVVDDLEWQELTPRYGYEIPKAVEDAELIDQFEACFELSLRLHGLIQEAGYTAEAQYATLLGHRMRWKVMYNAREAFHLHELRTSPHNRREVREIVQAMHDKVCQTHPLLGEAMKFASRD